MNKNNSIMLTTIDNPYNPREDYDKWRDWDNDNGYYTEQLVASMIDLSTSEPVDGEDDDVLMDIVRKAIADVLEDDELDIYVLV